ncbi:MAG: Ig-like domain-containing protein [Bacilli bacterium]|nr:Ig-like domain-containing protein [Bacilli bacterium]
MKKYILFLLLTFISLFFFACEETKPTNDKRQEEPTDDIKHQDDDKDEKKEKCIVSFYLDNELYISSEIGKDEKVSRPNDPKIDNAIFDGWFTGSDEEWNFDNTVSSDLSLYGKYHNKEVVNVTYEIYGENEMYVGYSQRLILTKTPEDATSSYTWCSSDESIAKVDENGVLSSFNTGTVDIMIVDENGDVKATFSIYISDGCDYPLPPNMGGYEIVIMNSKTALEDINPFLESYTKADKLYKQRAWIEVEQEFNCKISVIGYPDEAAYGNPRINWIINNATANQSQCDLAVISTSYIPKIAKENGLYDVSEYHRIYGRSQMGLALEEAGTYKGKLYVASTGLDDDRTLVDLGLYYNYGLLKKLGLDDPATLFNESEWNYTGFEAWVREAQEKMGEGKYALGGHPYYYLCGMTNAAGVKLADTQTMKTNATSVAAKNAMNLLQKLASDGCISDNVTWNDLPTRDGVDFFDGGVLMTTGNLTYFRTSQWSHYKANWINGQELGYVPFPYPDNLTKEESYAGTLSLSVYAYVAGRNYPDGIIMEYIYQAIDTLFYRSQVYEKYESSYNVIDVLYDSIKATIDNEASIEAMMYYNSLRVFFDPANGMYFSTVASPLCQVAIEVVLNKKDFDEAFASAANKYKQDFLEMYG